MNQLYRCSVNIFWLVVFLTVGSEMAAQPSSVRFRHFFDKPEISQNIIYDIVEDHYSFLWFATNNGLFRYDGYILQPFSFPQGNHQEVSFGTVRSLFVDHLGNLWIGTSDHGLFRMDVNDRTFTQYVNDQGNSNSISDNNIYCVYEDAGFNIWAGTRNGGACRLDIKQNTVTRFQKTDNGKSIVSINRIYQDKKGVLWMINDVGKYRYTSGRVIDCNVVVNSGYSRDFPSYIDRNQNKIIFKYNIPNNDSFYVLHLDKFQKGIVYTAAEFDTIEIIPDQPVIKTKDNKVWMVRYDHGLQCYDLNTSKFSFYKHSDENPASISSNKINVLFQDKAGNLWIGTSEGVDMVEANQAYMHVFTRYTQKNSTKIFNTRGVRSLYVDNAFNIWMGTEGDGLLKCDPKGNCQPFHFEEYDNSYGANYVNTIYADSKGLLWVGGPNGLQVFDKNSNRFIKKYLKPTQLGSLRISVWAIAEADDSGMWIGTREDGLMHLDPVSGTYQSFKANVHDNNSLGGNSVWKIVKDRQGVIWLGTNKGVSKLLNVKGKISFVNYIPFRGAKIAGSNIWDIFEGSDSVLWLASSDAQLIKMNKNNGAFSVFGAAEGLSAASIRSIIRDKEGRLWLGTENGIQVFNPFQKKVTKNINVNDGLHNNYLDCSYAAPNGAFYFGGHNGFTFFKPEEIKENNFKFPVAITSFKVLGAEYKKIITDGSTVYIQHDQNSFSIDFAALDYTNPAKNTFYYTLIGVDNQWIASDTRHYAAYSSLAPGSYTFLLYGMNNSGLRSANTLKINIIIVPAYWQTAWFKASFIVAGALLLIYMLFLIIRRQIDTRKRIHSELSTLRAQLNPHFIFNSLSSLQHFVAAQERDDALNYLEDFSTLMRRILENSQKQLVSLKEEIAFLESYIKMESLRLSHKVEFNMTIDPALVLHELLIPPMLIQPFIENSIKHGQLARQTAGRIDISFIAEARNYRCIVEDNGIGREMASIYQQKSNMNPEKKSLGIKITTSRVKLMKKKAGRNEPVIIYDLTEEKDGRRGTRIDIIIPYKIVGRFYTNEENIYKKVKTYVARGNN